MDWRVIEDGFKYGIEGKRSIMMIEIFFRMVERVLDYYENEGWGVGFGEKMMVNFVFDI